MKIITFRSAYLLVLLLGILTPTISFTQWQKQNLPITKGATIHMGFSGVSTDKNTLWLATHDFVADTNSISPIEFVRSADGGQTYQIGSILPNNDDYWYHLHPYDAKTAYLLTAYQFGEPYAILRTVDSGSTWQHLPFTPPTFPNLIHFYDTNNGIYVGDPDSLGAYFAYTTDGGNTFIRLPQTNYPPISGSDEFFAGGAYKIIGDAIFIPSYNTQTGLERLWRSSDRGRNWIASEWYDPESPYGGNFIFTDSNNGIMVKGEGKDQYAIYTTDGGLTWQNSGTLPGIVSGGPIDYVRGTNNIIILFQDTTLGILFSALTNDLGKTWHTRKNLVPYTLDPIYEPFGLAPFAWTNLEVIDNYTAWAKFSRTELYRYESTEPFVPLKPDLDLELTADNDGLPLYGSVKYTLTVKNRGISPATGVRINWLPPYKRTNNGAGAYAYQSAYASTGWYDSWNGLWSIDKLEGGASATATFHLFVVDNTKDVTQTAQVIAANETDLDSSPNNMSGTAKEDDEAGYVSKSNTTDMSLMAPKAPPSVWTISPNPAKENLTITINPTTDNNWTIQILNSIGQTIISQKGQNHQLLNIDVKNLESGLYIIEYQSNNERKVEKLLVQH